MSARLRQRRRVSRPSRSNGRFLVAGVALAVFILLGRNLRSLREGLIYLRQMLAWDSKRVKPVDPAGAFGVCHDLVGLDNAARQDLIIRRLRDLNLSPVLIPVLQEPLSNVLVPLRDTGPYTLFVAHYDKSRETDTYHGASDNTAAVAALLAALRDLVDHPPGRPVAFLFTAAEERGLRGARSFLSWSRAQGLAVQGVVNFDMIGRGRLASRPSALPGFYFWLPGLGEMVFDGRKLGRGGACPPPEPELLARLQAILGKDLVVYQRFTARSDSNVFQEAGLPSVSLSSDDMYYLDLVWERDADRVELLDEENLDLARRLVVDYALGRS
jgi:hypothetical protein